MWTWNICPASRTASRVLIWLRSARGRVSWPSVRPSRLRSRLSIRGRADTASQWSDNYLTTTKHYKRNLFLFCSTPQNSARLCVLGTGRECWRWIGSLKGGCVFCNFQPLDWEHTHTRTHLIEGNYFHMPTSWWLSLLAGWRLWPSSGDPAGSLWGGHEIRSPLRQWQRHSQVRDVCSDSAAEPRLRKLQVRLYRGSASCRVSVAQRQSESLTAILSFFST